MICALISLMLFSPRALPEGDLGLYIRNDKVKVSGKKIDLPPGYSNEVSAKALIVLKKGDYYLRVDKSKTGDAERITEVTRMKNWFGELNPATHKKLTAYDISTIRLDPTGKVINFTGCAGAAKVSTPVYAFISIPASLGLSESLNGGVLGNERLMSCMTISKSICNLVEKQFSDLTKKFDDTDNVSAVCNEFSADINQAILAIATQGKKESLKNELSEAKSALSAASGNSWLDFSFVDTTDQLTELEKQNKSNSPISQAQLYEGLSAYQSLCRASSGMFFASRAGKQKSNTESSAVQ